MDWGFIYMKRYMILIAVTCVVLCCILFVPQAVVASVPSVEVTALSDVEDHQTIDVEGTIEEKNKTVMSASYPFIPDEVFVNVGQEVEVGDILATVNVSETFEAIAALGSKLSSLSSEQFDKLTQQYQLNTSINLEDYPKEIIATASGVISSVYLQEGEFFFPGQPMINISDLSHLMIDASVGESSIAQICVGDSVQITGESLGNQSYAGSVTSIAPTATTRLNGITNETVVDVQIEMQEIDESLKPGCHVDVSIDVGDGTIMQTLPYQAITQDESGNEYVYIYHDGRAYRRDVTTGKEFTETVEIVGGLGKEDLVIIPADAISKDAQRVRSVQ